jgi:hypothetical protein
LLGGDGGANELVSASALTRFGVHHTGLR